jgi:hypothetical protein
MTFFSKLISRQRKPKGHVEKLVNYILGKKYEVGEK